MPKVPKMPKIEDEYHFIFKKIERSDSTLRHSIFDILRFCGSLFDFAKSHTRGSGFVADLKHYCIKFEEITYGN